MNYFVNIILYFFNSQISKTAILNHQMHKKKQIHSILKDKSLCELKRKLIIKTIPLYFYSTIASKIQLLLLFLSLL